MSKELTGFEGKVAFITGGGRGQGASHAVALAKAGCDIAVIDVCDSIPGFYPMASTDDLARTVTEVEAFDRQAVSAVADVRDEDAIKQAVDLTLDRFGKIDILINNAGVCELSNIHEMDASVLDATIDINLKGPMYTTKHVVPNMIGRRSGKIINISSAVIGSGHSQLSHYVASKHGVVGLTRAWATELAEFGIAVNAIAPATIKPVRDHGSYMIIGVGDQLGQDPDESYAMWSEMSNLADFRAETKDITEAVMFLASDSARVITGHTLNVDCGQATR